MSCDYCSRVFFRSAALDCSVEILEVVDNFELVSVRFLGRLQSVGKSYVKEIAKKITNTTSRNQNKSITGIPLSATGNSSNYSPGLSGMRICWTQCLICLSAIKTESSRLCRSSQKPWRWPSMRRAVAHPPGEAVQLYSASGSPKE